MARWHAASRRSRHHRPSGKVQGQEDGWVETAIDGISTSTIDDLSTADYAALLEDQARFAVAHPNGATGIYTICVSTPAPPPHAIDAFGEAGLALRRCSNGRVLLIGQFNDL